MRAFKVLRSLLGIEKTLVRGFSVENGALVLQVTPAWQKPRCSGCGSKSVPIYDQHRGRSWRHLDWGGVEVVLRHDIRRVTCKACGIVVEKVPWADDVSGRFTRDFEDQVAFCAQRTDKTSVQKIFNIAWRTVGTIVERVVRRLRPKDPLANLAFIGVDELSYRKQHHYITLVTDHEKRQIVWGKEGKNAETLMAFFDELGAERCKEILVVTMDMSGAFIKAVRDRLPHAQIVFDRFHVQKLVSDALDQTRRDEWQLLRGTPRAASLKKLRWALLKSPWNLRPSESSKLTSLEKLNEPLYRAYLMKESFAEILDRQQIHVVEKKLEEWIEWAESSNLPRFVKVAQTIKHHLKDIVAYVRWKLSNGLIEGLNNKARLLTRRAYGFHSAAAVISMIQLCCTGLELDPIRKLLKL